MSVDSTGELQAIYRPGQPPQLSAPWRTTIDTAALPDLEPDQAGVVELEGLRYYVGSAHPCRPGRVYLHRLA